MNKSNVSSIQIQDFSLWEDIKDKRIPTSFTLELTARCNNDCRHCYINLPMRDKVAREAELSFEEIKGIIDEAVSLGVIWCTVTGGEPLLREDFLDIYLYLKKKGLLIQLLTNAIPIGERHIKVFKKYPPRDIEVSVYGVTQETYERVTRKPGSFDHFMRGLDLLLESGVRVRLKTMALHSNLHEIPEITRFCQERTKDFFRFDPQLHLRFDGNPERNEEIKSERLSPEEIVALEQADPERVQAMKEDDTLIRPEFSNITSDRLFRCAVGRNSFDVTYDGHLRLCSSLCHPDCVYDLRKGSLTDAWRNFVPQIQNMRSDRKEFLENCRVCPHLNLCLWCPAHAHLETGDMESRVDTFCRIAHARATAVKALKT